MPLQHQRGYNTIFDSIININETKMLCGVQLVTIPDVEPYILVVRTSMDTSIKLEMALNLYYHQMLDEV